MHMKDKVEIVQKVQKKVKGRINSNMGEKVNDGGGGDGGDEETAFKGLFVKEHGISGNQEIH
jgi:hypothetical protein